MAENTFKAPEFIARWQTVALGVGAVFTLIWAAGLIMGMSNPRGMEFALRGWLLGFIFWGGIAFGGLGIILLQYLTGGAWGVVIRRIVEACARTIFPGVLILFLPILFGVYRLYEWANIPNDIMIQRRGIYLQPMWWGARAVFYFVLLGIMSYLLNKWAAKQDAAESYEESAMYLGTATRFSGPTIVVFVLLVTFMSVDWTMTLEPHWFSTIWGFLFVDGWVLSCFCFSVALMAYMSDKAPLDRVLGKRHFHDIGKLMLALVMVWAYFNFSQYLIIWSGNLTEETPFYIARSQGGWGAVGLILILFHFAFPFLILLMQDFKRKAKWLAVLAIFILLMRLVDMLFIIGPSPMIGEIASHASMLKVPFAERFSIWYIVGPLAVGGWWLFFFFREYRKRPLVPSKDPFFENAIKHGKGH